MVGSEGLGRVFIGPSCLFGMVKPSPGCATGPNSGWLPELTPVTGFAQVHVSGTGGGPKYGNILPMPFRGPLALGDKAAHRPREHAELGYHQTQLAGAGPAEAGIGVEITASPKVSFYRIACPRQQPRARQLDAGFFLGVGEQPEPDGREAQQFVGSEAEVVSASEVRGDSRVRGGWNNGPAHTVYFAAVSDAPVAEFAARKGTRLQPGQKQQADPGEKTGVLLRFVNGASDTLR